MNEEEKRVGVMFRLDVWRPLMESLTGEEAGRILYASLLYADEGTEPEFPSEKLSRLWDMQKSIMDRDAERFRARMRRRSYEAYVRETQRRKAPVLPFEDWTGLYWKGGGGNGGNADAGIH